MLPPDLIRACYKLLLGREPESEAVVARAAEAASHEALLDAFLTSEEYRRRFPPSFQSAYLAAPARVDVDVPPQALAAMFERIRQEWSKLGDEDPYWSVLTDEAYRGDALTQAQTAAFYETGADTARAIDVFAARAGVAIPTGRCVEFGCGVGRVTSHLAKRFDEVVAVDISPRNLEICVETLRGQGCRNITPLLLKSPEDAAGIPAHDLLFSTIVLQHNPPPVQAFLLDILLSKLNPGGMFLVQIPTHTPDYAFDAEAYLASPVIDMELHNLPMPDVFRLLTKHRAEPLEVLMDAWTGLYGSHTFFGVKAGG
jgi:SAM-dependent methyltransferase